MKYFNVSKEEVESKMFNIFVGISLGNKLLTPELARHYIQWAHKYSKDDAVILVADEIDAVNWQIFNDLPKDEADQKVRDKGYGIAGMFDKAARTLSRETGDAGYISRVHTIFWEDIKNPGYEYLRQILQEKYETVPEFKQAVLYFVDKYIKLRDKDVAATEKDRLAGYIISELPTLLGGIYWDSKLYNLILYPTYIDSGMSQFVLDIRGGKYFDASELQLRQIAVMVEDYLEKPTTTYPS